MENEPKNINVSVNEGDAFFCHELSINYNPMQFVLDFKSVTPRVDIRSKDTPSIAIKHNVVLLDPYHAKQTLELLSKVMAGFEKDYGKVTKPKALEAMEKKAAKEGKAQPKTASQTLSPSYFG